MPAGHALLREGHPGDIILRCRQLLRCLEDSCAVLMAPAKNLVNLPPGLPTGPLVSLGAVVYCFWLLYFERASTISLASFVWLPHSRCTNVLSKQSNECCERGHGEGSLCQYNAPGYHVCCRYSVLGPQASRRSGRKMARFWEMSLHSAAPCDSHLMALRWLLLLTRWSLGRTTHAPNMSWMSATWPIGRGSQHQVSLRWRRALVRWSQILSTQSQPGYA